VADVVRRPSGSFGYRLMLWEYALRDRLHVDPPEPHLAIVPLREGMTVVDWGCGPGRFDVPLARRVGANGRVYAVDIQPLAIAAVRRRVAKAGIANVTPVLSEPYSAPLPDAITDVVIFLDAFHAIGDRTALLREMRRVLKPGGLLYMDPGHMPMAQARAAIEASGAFTISRSEGKHLFLTPV
jgi:ubiquinone/menaquinone biosynthesis C-methylase UbiE